MSDLPVKQFKFYNVSITEVNSHRLCFVINKGSSFYPVIDGYMKWDGCLDWMTTPNAYAHACRIGQIEELRDCFIWISEQAFDLLEEGDGLIADNWLPEDEASS